MARATQELLKLPELNELPYLGKDHTRTAVTQRGPKTLGWFLQTL